MHAQLLIDPRIRDYVFLPLCVLMIAVQLLRIYGMKYMNEPKNPLLEPAQVSYKALQGTLFEADADMSKELPSGQIDIAKILEEGDKGQNREVKAMLRSQKLRLCAEFLPENSLKVRKAYFCNEQNGFLNRVVETPKMDLMGNPDMMNNMLKQNLQSVVYMMTFNVIGSIFQGFITAQVPFPLGVKFKQMLQQGLLVTALDPTYVSTMSW